MNTYSDFIVKNWTRNDVIGSHCRQFCGSDNDCHQEQYDSRSESYTAKDQFIIQVNHLSVPDQQITHSPKIIFEEFVSLLGSLISLWFGFSIITLFDMISVVNRYLFRYFQINFVNKYFLKNETKNKFIICLHH